MPELPYLRASLLDRLDRGGWVGRRISRNEWFFVKSNWGCRLVEFLKLPRNMPKPPRGIRSIWKQVRFHRLYQGG